MTKQIKAKGRYDATVWEVVANYCKEEDPSNFRLCSLDFVPDGRIQNVQTHTVKIFADALRKLQEGADYVVLDEMVEFRRIEGAPPLRCPVLLRKLDDMRVRIDSELGGVNVAGDGKWIQQVGDAMMFWAEAPPFVSVCNP